MYYKLIRNISPSVSPELNSGNAAVPDPSSPSSNDNSKAVPDPSSPSSNDNSKSVPGTLCSVEHRYSGGAGEYKEYLTPICSTIENADYLIPALVYKVQVTQSPRFKRLLPILSQVPGRTGIRVHRGSRPEHSKGCILVSPDNEKLLTELWLKAQNDHETTYLDICAPR